MDVHTDAGRIHADRVIVATGVPTPLFKPLARHFWFQTTYLAMTEPVPARHAVYCERVERFKQLYPLLKDYLHQS